MCPENLRELTRSICVTYSPQDRVPGYDPPRIVNRMINCLPMYIKHKAFIVGGVAIAWGTLIAVRCQYTMHVKGRGHNTYDGR